MLTLYDDIIIVVLAVLLGVIFVGVVITVLSCPDTTSPWTANLYLLFLLLLLLLLLLYNYHRYHSSVFTRSTHVQGALEMVTATHQLVSSIYALGLCARPLLLAGLPPDPALGQEGPPSREAAAQALATAMMQMLPAIDVNDSAKTLVAIRFYMAVLSSVASLEVRPDVFCLLVSPCSLCSCQLHRYSMGMRSFICASKLSTNLKMLKRTVKHTIIIPRFMRNHGSNLFSPFFSLHLMW